jgi:hypothetical protein
MSRISVLAANLSGAPASSTIGAAAVINVDTPPPMPSAPRTGATPPSTPAATTRSGMAAAQASV